MNKLLIPSTNIGGHPLTLNDLRFLQDAILDALKGLGAGFGNALDDTYILAGCEVVLAGVLTYNVAEGYMLYKGEVCKVDAHTYIGSLATAKWDVAGSIYDIGSEKAYKSGAIYQTRQIRKVKLWIGILAPLGILYTLAERLPAKMLTLLSTAYEWINISFAASFSDYETAGVNDCAVRLDRINAMVMMKGRLKRTPPLSHTANVQVATLPDALYFPSVDRYVHGASVAGNFDGSKPVTYIIKSDGSIWLMASVTTSMASGDLYLDGISYSL